MEKELTTTDIVAWSNFFKDDPLCKVFLAHKADEKCIQLVIVKAHNNEAIRFDLPTKKHPDWSKK